MEQTPSVEQEIQDLEQALLEKKRLLGQQNQPEGTNLPNISHDKEMISQVLEEEGIGRGSFDYAQTEGRQGGDRSPSGELSNTTAVQNDDGQQVSQTVTDSAPEINPPSYLSEELKGKVQSFINVAFEKSIKEAVKEARATNNAALIDAFHDALVDELYQQLTERGKLKTL